MKLRITYELDIDDTTIRESYNELCEIDEHTIARDAIHRSCSCGNRHLEIDTIRFDVEKI